MRGGASIWTVESFRWRLRTSVGRITEGKLPPGADEFTELRLKKVERKEGLTWVLRYRIDGKEQTPLLVGLVGDFPTRTTRMSRPIALAFVHKSMCGTGVRKGA